MPFKYIHFQVRRFAIVLYIALILIILTAIVILKSRSFTAGKAWVDHTTEVIITLQKVQIIILDAETGQRGYALTGDPNYLEPYNNALYVIYQNVNHLEYLVLDNPIQVQRVNELKSLVNKRLVTLKEIITVRDRDGLQAAINVLVNRHRKNFTDDIRVIIIKMLDEERRLMQQRLLIVDDAAFVLNISLIIIVVRDILIIIMIGYNINGIRRNSTKQFNVERRN